MLIVVHVYNFMFTVHYALYINLRYIMHYILTYVFV